MENMHLAGLDSSVVAGLPEELFIPGGEVLHLLFGYGIHYLTFQGTE
jgi:hypothetical protein